MYCAIYFAGACAFAYACVFYILRVYDIIHRHIRHGPTTPAPVSYVMYIIKPARDYVKYLPHARIMIMIALPEMIKKAS